MESACRARIKPATKQEIPFALSLLNGVVRESDQMESLKPSRDVIMSTADTYVRARIDTDTKERAVHT